MRARAIHPVVLAGAGPGDPGLLTVAALAAIRDADVIVVDRLVSSEVLGERSPHAKVIYVGKAPGDHAVPQEMIQELLVAQARTGRKVVRLKGGDPMVFGRGGEEALALKRAGIPYRIIPGISSAVAVPAYAGIPLTLRGVAARFTVVAGSTAEIGAVPDEGWRAVASGDETLVVLMGFANLHIIVETPGARRGREHAGRRDRAGHHKRAARRALAARGSCDAVTAANLSAPTVIGVGAATGLPERLDWCETSEALGSALGRPGDVPADMPARGAKVGVASPARAGFASNGGAR
jgi:uroporphyrin-III C-methyltransferase